MSNLTDRRRGTGLPRGIIFLLLFLTYILTGINTYRLQPVLASAMDFLGADEAKMGVIMSVPSFVALFTTMLAGFLVMRIGYCSSMTVAVVLELLGLAVALKAPDYQGVIASQVALGLGNTLLMVTAPSIMQAVYTPDEYAMRIGVINSAQTAGQGLVFLLLPTLIINAGFTSVWSVFLIPTGIILLVWIVLWIRGEEKHFAVSPSEKADSAAEEPAGDSPFPLKDWRFWVMIAGILFCMISAGAALNYTALYLKSVKGFSETVSGNMMFGCTALGVVAAMAGGPLGRKFGPRRVYVLIALLQTALRALIVVFNSAVPLFIVIMLSGVPAAMIVICNSAVPRLCLNRRYTPVAVSMIATATTGGLALSSLIFGKLITLIGFDASFYVFVPVSLLALLSAIVIPKD